MQSINRRWQTQSEIILTNGQISGFFKFTLVLFTYSLLIAVIKHFLSVPSVTLVILLVRLEIYSEIRRYTHHARHLLYLALADDITPPAHQN